jgi:hypothetical protein
VEQWAEIRRLYFVKRLSIKGDRPAHRPRSQHDPAGAALG